MQFFSEEMGKSKEEIAEILGITKQTVQNIYRTGAEVFKEKIIDFDKSDVFTSIFWLFIIWAFYGPG